MFNLKIKIQRWVDMTKLLVGTLILIMFMMPNLKFKFLWILMEIYVKLISLLMMFKIVILIFMMNYQKKAKRRTFIYQVMIWSLIFLCYCFLLLLLFTQFLMFLILSNYTLSKRFKERRNDSFRKIKVELRNIKRWNKS
jgi:hypothetical protein